MIRNYLENESPNRKRGQNFTPQREQPAQKRQKTDQTTIPSTSESTSATEVIPFQPLIPPRKKKATPWSEIMKNVPEVLDSTSESSKLNLTGGFEITDE